MHEVKSKMAVLGCGQMGGAIVRGMVSGKIPMNFHTFTPSQVRAQELALNVSGVFHPRLEELPACDFYLLACKPQQFGALALELKKHLPPQAVVISLLAGVRISTLSNLLGQHKKLVRAMPNTPCRINQGMTLLYFPPAESSALTATEKLEVERMLSSTGKTLLLKSEEDFDPLTGLTSSGPALIFEMARSLEHQLLHWNIVDAKAARELVAQVFLGSALLMDENEGTSFEQLREQVTSKGGITFAALNVLKEGQWQKLLADSLEAARKRSVELGLA